MGEAPEEKRRSTRIGKSLVVLYSDTPSEDRKSWDMTFVMDVSETGMKITTQKCFFPNTTLFFYAKIPTRPFEWFEFSGRVVESKELKSAYNEPIAGIHVTRIEFIDLEEEHKKVIKEYIAWFLSKKGG